ncbi:MFS transporter [uncultured Paracoccus sp.]|uniref:MFS transporter n=1 Tax=uncultured Paracoccus sp. TaxID=189685 RepID=UPI0025E11AC5|nr:MFS transporter [uncultured Paracoccus sp.]
MTDEQRATEGLAAPLDPRVVQPGKSDYRLYLLMRAFSTLAISNLNLVVAWTLYDISGNPFYLGLAGLILFLPSLVLMLAVGIAVDRFDRQKVAAVCYALLFTSAAILTWLSFSQNLHPAPILSVLGIVGCARAFLNPTIKALLVNLVDRRDLPRAIALNASLTKIAVVTGPIAGGVLYSVSPTLALGTSAVVFLLSLAVALVLRATTQTKLSTTVRIGDLLGGFYAIRNDRTLLGTISLDFFVMFISGATALLPVYAKDILGTDAVGLGMLRASPALGAFAMAALLAWRPIRRDAGKTMLACVAGYGVAILVFGVSTSFWLSCAALFASGVMDMVSVNVRESLVQLRTPDQMRGRVTAVNSVFVGASNELGDFRAGSFAVIFGAVPAVVFGGVVALCIAAGWYKWFPDMRRIDQLG